MRVRRQTMKLLTLLSGRGHKRIHPKYGNSGENNYVFIVRPEQARNQTTPIGGD